MNKFKDFFYNKNDIIIVLLILAAAAFVIYDRMETIMEYPDTVAAQQAQQEAEAEAQQATDTKKDTEATTKAAKGEVVKIKVAKNNTLSDVSNMLADKGLVSSADEFTKYAEDKGKDGSIIDGTYEIEKGTSMAEILKILTHGK